jgi:peptidoglycan hydrolase CwlO-like protein
MKDRFTQLEVRQVELEQQMNSLQSAQKNNPTQQHPLNQTQRAGGGERHICTLDCGETTSTGERAGEE